MFETSTCGSAEVSLGRSFSGTFVLLQRTSEPKHDLSGAREGFALEVGKPLAHCFAEPPAALAHGPSQRSKSLLRQSDDVPPPILLIDRALNKLQSLQSNQQPT
jgi:hypothetical protein